MFWQTDNSNVISAYGSIAVSAIEQIPKKYPGVSVDAFVVMPDHIHLILVIHNEYQASISTIINQFKGYVTKQIGSSVWQKGFYDHIIRDEVDYIQRWNYIADNPDRWIASHS